MEIREAVKKDVLQLSELFRQELECHQGLDCYYELLTDFDWIAYAEERMKDRERLVVVAEHGECLAGFIVARIMNYPPDNRYKTILRRIVHYVKKPTPLPIKPMRWGLIEDCYVMPSLRKQGIGRRLVLGAIKWFHSKQVSRVELFLTTGNNEGEAFWEKVYEETLDQHIDDFEGGNVSSWNFSGDVVNISINDNSSYVYEETYSMNVSINFTNGNATISRNFALTQSLQSFELVRGLNPNISPICLLVITSYSLKSSKILRCLGSSFFSKGDKSFCFGL